MNIPQDEYAHWREAKKKVYKYPADYERIINYYKKNKPEKMDIKKNEYGSAVTIDMGLVDGYELEFQVIDSRKRKGIQAKYFLWNNKWSIVYIRDVFELPEDLAEIKNEANTSKQTEQGML